MASVSIRPHAYLTPAWNVYHASSSPMANLKYAAMQIILKSVGDQCRNRPPVINRLLQATALFWSTIQLSSNSDTAWLHRVPWSIRTTSSNGFLIARKGSLRWIHFILQPVSNAPTSAMRTIYPFHAFFRPAQRWCRPFNHGDTVPLTCHLRPSMRIIPPCRPGLSWSLKPDQFTASGMKING